MNYINTFSTNKFKFKKFFQSKIIVMLSLMALTIGCFTFISQAKADYSLSTVYQYFLLDNRAGGADKESSQSLTEKAIVGVLGSGGNVGTFSYQDIVNGATDKSVAKKFVTAMATYNGYNYLSFSSNSLTNVLLIIMRWLVGFILLIFGFITDILQGSFSNIIHIFATFNVFSIIANAFVSSSLGASVSSAVGITSDQIKSVVEVGLSIASIMIVLSLVWALRNGGSKLDQVAMKKWKGRLIALVGVPVVIVAGAMMINEISGMTGTLSSSSIYADWLIDTQSWAYNDNFEPQGADVTTNSNYIDTNFNPYKSSSAVSSFKNTLWNSSDLHTNTLGNTTLAIAYMSGQTYNARTYLGNLTDPNNKNQSNSIYSILYSRGSWSDGKHKFGKLYDFDNSYSSLGTAESSWSTDSPSKASSKDYGSAGSPNENEYNTWAERYIYGAKNSGDIKSYYAEQPSDEQINSGANGTDGFSDASMFLILSTQFNEQGGTFALDGPARGAYGQISKFDSSRGDYMRISMLGLPIFTIPAMLSRTIFTFVIAMAVIFALLSVGLLEMNLKPLRAWIKGISLGDLEFVMALFIYSIGIVGSIIMMTIMPQIIINFFEGATKDIVSALPDVSSESTVIGSETKYGFIGIASFVMSLTALIMFIKVPKFRDSLIELMMIPWLWASTKGEQLEAQAGDGSISHGKSKFNQKQEKGREKRTEAYKKLANTDGFASRMADKFSGGATSKLAKSALEQQVRSGSLDMGGKADSTHTKKQADIELIRQMGISQRGAKNVRSFDNKLSDKKNKFFSKKNIENLVPNGLKKGNELSLEPDNIEGLSQQDIDVRKDLGEEQNVINAEKAHNNERKEELGKIDKASLPREQKQVYEEEVNKINERARELENAQKQHNKRVETYKQNVAQRRQSLTDPEKRRQNMKVFSRKLAGTMDSFQKHPDAQTAQKLNSALQELEASARRFGVKTDQNGNLDRGQLKEFAGFDVEQAKQDINSVSKKGFDSQQNGQIVEDGQGNYEQVGMTNFAPTHNYKLSEKMGELQKPIISSLGSVEQSSSKVLEKQHDFKPTEFTNILVKVTQGVNHSDLTKTTSSIRKVENYVRTLSPEAKDNYNATYKQTVDKLLEQSRLAIKKELATQSSLNISDRQNTDVHDRADFNDAVKKIKKSIEDTMDEETIFDK